MPLEMTPEMLVQLALFISIIPFLLIPVMLSVKQLVMLHNK